MAIVHFSLIWAIISSSFLYNRIPVIPICPDKTMWQQSGIFIKAHLLHFLWVYAIHYMTIWSTAKESIWMFSWGVLQCSSFSLAWLFNWRHCYNCDSNTRVCWFWIHLFEEENSVRILRLCLCVIFPGAWFHAWAAGPQLVSNHHLLLFANNWSAR